MTNDELTRANILEKVFGDMSEVEKVVASGEKPKEKYDIVAAFKVLEELSNDQYLMLVRIVEKTPYNIFRYVQYFGIPEEIKKYEVEE